MSLERLLERQLERLPVLATIALVRVCFSIAVIPQRRHQGEPHGPGTTLTKHKWRNWISVEWFAKTCDFLSSDRASERGQETPKRLAVRVRARALCAGVSIDGNMRPSINGSLYKIAHFDRADGNLV